MFCSLGNAVPFFCEWKTKSKEIKTAKNIKSTKLRTGWESEKNNSHTRHCIRTFVEQEQRNSKRSIVRDLYDEIDSRWVCWEGEKRREQEERRGWNKNNIKLCIRTRYSKRQTKWSNSIICSEVKITENEPPLGLCCTCSKYVVQATFNSLFLFLSSSLHSYRTRLPAHILGGILSFFCSAEQRQQSFKKRSNIVWEMKLISFP